MNTFDILIVILIAAAVALAVWRVIRNKKQGKSSCGCDCGHCAMKCGKRE